MTVIDFFYFKLIFNKIAIAFDGKTLVNLNEKHNYQQIPKRLYKWHIIEQSS